MTKFERHPSCPKCDRSDICIRYYAGSYQYTLNGKNELHPSSLQVVCNTCCYGWNMQTSDSCCE